MAGPLQSQTKALPLPPIQPRNLRPPQQSPFESSDSQALGGQCYRQPVGLQARSAEISRAMSRLLSGGPIGRGTAAILHSVVWAQRHALGKYDSAEMGLLDDLDLLNRVAIDVGAHAGNWTVNLARRVGPAGLVLAYEALPHYARSLSMTMRLMRVTNVKMRPVAVGEREQTISLRWRSNGNELLTGKTHLEPASAPSSDVIEVQMVSLDRDLKLLGIRPRDVGFVKIDVEGAELMVLKGASNLLSAGRPVVYLEAEPVWLKRVGHSVNDLFGTMQSHGYLPHLVAESGVLSTNAAEYLSQYATEPGLNNVLFLPRS